MINGAVVVFSGQAAKESAIQRIYTWIGEASFQGRQNVGTMYDAIIRSRVYLDLVASRPRR